MNREHILSILYDLTLTIGSEAKVDALLVKVLQRLLFHTSFPVGLVVLEQVSQGDTIRGLLASVVGDHLLAKLTGTPVELPAELLQGTTALQSDDRFVKAFPGSRPYHHCLRLPIDESGTLLLLSPLPLETDLPLTEIFQPVLRNLSRAIKLCRHSEQLTQRLESDRDHARSELAEALQRSETERVFLRNLKNTIPDLVWLKDQEGIYLACNPEFERFIGKPEADIVGKSDYDFMDAQLADFSRGHDRAAMAAGKPTVNEEWITFADDGHRALLVTTKTPMYAADGTLIGVLGISHDITELRCSEDALRQSKADLQHASRLAGLGYWNWNLETNSHIWSEDIYRFYGRDLSLPPATYPDEVQRYFIPASWEALAAAVNACVSDGIPYVCDAEIVRPDGAHAWITARGEAVRDSRGKVVELRGTVQDITERKRVEEELRTTNDLLRKVIENAPLRVFWKDRNSRYLGCNSQFARDAGCQSPEEIIGASDYDLGWKAQAELYRDDDKAVMASGLPKLNFAEPQTTPDGRSIVLRTSKVPLRDSRGEVIGVLGIYDDITDLKQAEEQRRIQLEELRRWQEVMLGREDRILSLKREVNELLASHGQAPRYVSAPINEDTE